MGTVDDLRGEYEVAQQQGRGTDMARIGKQLAALGAGLPGKQTGTVHEPAEPAARVRREQMPERSEPPRGRRRERPSES